jgi:hypothetical protein
MRRNVEEEEESRWMKRILIIMLVSQKRMNNEIGHEIVDCEFCERSVD